MHKNTSCIKLDTDYYLWKGQNNKLQLFHFHKWSPCNTDSNTKNMSYKLMKRKFNKCMHAVASQERNTFTFVLVRLTGCAILDALRAQKWKMTIHNQSIRMSPQNDFWQLTGGDCQQCRNESGWKERKDPLQN